MIKKEKNVGAVVAVGVGIAAATVAAYLLFGPEGKKNRKVIKGWVVKMKGEIIEALEKVQNVTEPAYNKVVDTISAKYAKAKNIDKQELEAVVADLRKHWKVISKGTKTTKAKTVKAKK